MSSVAQSNLPLQNIGTLHRFNTLLGGFLAAKLDEAEAFRILRDWIINDLCIEAAWEVFLEGVQENLMRDLRVQVAHIDLRFTAASSLSSPLVTLIATIVSLEVAAFSSKASAAIVATHHLVASHAHITTRATRSCIAPLAHITAHPVHARLATLSWVSMVLILIVSTRAVRGPVQLVVANGVRYLLAVQCHEDVLGDLVIRELNEAVAYRGG